MSQPMPFVSEFTSVSEAIGSGQFLTGGLFLLFLCVVFFGMGSTVLSMVQGESQPATDEFHDTFGTCAPILLSMALVLMMGIYIPPPLEALVRDAAAFLEAPR